MAKHRESWTGDGSGRNIDIGWTPQDAIIIDHTKKKIVHWNDLMLTNTTPSYGLLVSSVSATSNLTSAATGLSRYTGSSSAAKGITVGATLNVNNSEMSLVANKDEDNSSSDN